MDNSVNILHTYIYPKQHKQYNAGQTAIKYAKVLINNGTLSLKYKKVLTQKFKDFLFFFLNCLRIGCIVWKGSSFLCFLKKNTMNVILNNSDQLVHTWNWAVTSRIWGVRQRMKMN